MFDGQQLTRGAGRLRQQSKVAAGIGDVLFHDQLVPCAYDDLRVVADADLLVAKSARPSGIRVSRRRSDTAKKLICTRDGYYLEEGGDGSSEAFRMKALFTPTDNFSAPIGYAQEFNVMRSGGVPIRQGDSPTDFIYTPQDVGTGRNHFRQYWANFKLDLGPVEINYIPAVRTWYQNATIVARGTVFNADQTILTPDDKFVTYELRIHSTPNDSKFSRQTGAMYYRNTLTTVNNLYNRDLGRFLYKDNTDKASTAVGVFAEGIYAFVPTTCLTAGVRYDYTKVAVEQDYISVLGTTATLRSDEDVQQFNNFTYKARIEHDLAARNLVYASISTGFSPGDITLTTGQDFQPVVQTLKAETLTAYEVGSKNRFLNDRLQINGALFYYDHAGYQTAQINLTPENPGNPIFATITVPLKSYGAEREVQARPWKSGTFSLNGSYTNARYGDFGIYKPFFSTQKVSGVPPLQGNVAYDHRIPLGGEATLALRGVVRFFTAHDRSRLTEEWAALGAGPYGHVKSQALADFNATLIVNSQFAITGAHTRGQSRAGITRRRHTVNSIKIVATLQAKSGKTDELRTLLDGMLAPSRAEPGNLRYDVWRDQADVGRFVLDELYADGDAVAAHRATPHFQLYATAINDLAERSIVVLDPVDVT